jgi:hypothetical protein
MCGRNAQFAAVLLSSTLLVNRASAWAGRRKRSPGIDAWYALYDRRRDEVSLDEVERIVI